MKKMIVTDLDGTLLTSKRECLDVNIKYLKHLKDNGHIVVIATGRVLDSAVVVTKGAFFADYIISNNGSLIYDVNNKKEVFQKTIDKKLLKKICSYYDNNIINCIDLCDNTYYNKYTDNGHNGLSHTNMITNIEDFINKANNIFHMTLFFNNDNDVDKVYKKLKKEVPELDYLIMLDSYRPIRLIEVFSKDTNKYEAIKIISNQEKVNNKDIIAFGDSHNDLDMIERCGTGVAMKNAIPELKEVADYVTLSNNENGIIHFFENIKI